MRLSDGLGSVSRSAPRINCQPGSGPGPPAVPDRLVAAAERLGLNTLWASESQGSEALPAGPMAVVGDRGGRPEAQ
jgi:hypothetical protein